MSHLTRTRPALRRVLVPGLLAAVMLFAAVAQAQPGRWQRVRADGWTLQIPGDWRAFPAPEVPGADIVGMWVSSNGFPNLNIARESSHGLVSLTYGQANLNAIRQSGIVNVVGQREIRVGRERVLEVEAGWPRNQPPTHTLQRFYVRGQHGYTLTCSDTPAGFERARGTCQRILDSATHP